MPPTLYSRHRFSSGVLDEDDEKLMLSDPLTFGYQERSDNILHRVAQGEDLFQIAGKYFSSITRGCGLWWAIADYQPVPIHDPTIALAEGTIIVVPSVRTVLEEILNNSRLENETT